MDPIDQSSNQQPPITNTQPQTPLAEQSASQQTIPPETNPVQTPVPPKQTGMIRFLLFVPAIVVLGIIGYFALSKFNNQQSESALTPSSTPAPTELANPTKVISEPTSNWTSFKIAGITVQYPGAWGDKPDVLDSAFGPLARITYKGDPYYELTLLTGLNKNSTPEELKNFINDNVNNGGKSLTIDGSPAFLGSTTDTSGNGRIITCYFIAKDSKSLYSLSILTAKTNTEAENLFNQILSKVKFTDNSS